MVRPAPRLVAVLSRLRLDATWAAFAALLLIGIVPAAWSAAELPTLTGRVVDDANLLPADAQSRIESKLRTLEDQSGIQLVVATLPSLGGEEIEPYANRLFRAWKLGQAKRNNGVLVLVAVKERKARIEVGYGLEGTLTDAISKLVIVNAMAPKFKTGDFGAGIESGVDDVIAVLSTDKSEWEKRPHLKPQTDGGGGALVIFIVLGVIVLVVVLSMRNGRGGRPGRRSPGWVVVPGGDATSWSSGGSSSGGDSSSDSGFSGGGGSSGGGGASGDW